MNAEPLPLDYVNSIPEGSRMVSHTLGNGLIIGGYDVIYGADFKIAAAQPPGIFLGIMLAGQTTDMLVENVGAMRIPVGQPLIVNFSEQVNCTNSYAAREHCAGVGISIPSDFAHRETDPVKLRELAPLLALMDRPTDIEVFAQSNDIARLASDVIAVDPSGPGAVLRLEGLAFMLLSAFCRALTLAEARPQTAIHLSDSEWRRVQHIAEHLNANLAETPSLKELSRRAGINQTTLSEQFKAAHGETIFSYLRNRRLEAARTLLRSGNTSVTDTSFSVGFSSATSFATAFRRRFGYPPSQEVMANLDRG